MASPFTGRPAVGGDDGCLTAVNFYGAETWIALGEATGAYHAYFRVPNIAGILQGANIITAKLTLKAWEARAETVCRFNIYMNDVDNAVAPTSIAEFNALALTAAFTAWDGEGAWVNNNTYDSDDFASGVQEVVNRPGWSPNNAMMVIIKDDGSDANARRVADAQNLGETTAALFTVEYTNPVAVKSKPIFW